jgi:ubiquinone/menaquinone biosynthesis C-methylase UbiE
MRALTEKQSIWRQKLKEYLEYERLQRDKEAPIFDIAFTNEYEEIVEWQSVYSTFELNRNDLILDAGCGTGRLSERLNHLGCRVVGIDFSIESLKIHKRRTDSKLVAGNLLCLPFKDKTFDKILCSQVLEHILEYDDAITLLRELKRVLKNNGEVIITTFNYPLIDRIKSNKIIIDYKAINYLKYTKNEFKNMLLKVFDKGEIKCMCGLLNLKRPSKLDRILWCSKKRKYFLSLDFLIQKSFLSFYLGHLLLVKLTNET